jgi:hypothetical protein
LNNENRSIEQALRTKKRTARLRFSSGRAAKRMRCVPMTGDGRHRDAKPDRGKGQAGEAQTSHHVPMWEQKRQRKRRDSSSSRLEAKRRPVCGVARLFITGGSRGQDNLIVLLVVANSCLMSHYDAAGWLGRVSLTAWSQEESCEAGARTF